MGCGASRATEQEGNAGAVDNKKKMREVPDQAQDNEAQDHQDEKTHKEEKSKTDKKEKTKDADSSDSDSDDDSKSKRKPKAKPVIVFVLGGPGSGKGTQCERIVKDYGFTHLSVGDLLRAEKAAGSKAAQLIDQYISEGKLVPAKIPVKLIKKAMRKAGWEYSYYLIDGFPRNQENLDAWNKVFKDSVDVKFTLYYDCSFETMEARILERSKTSGRSDDNPEAIKKRFDTYQNETRPVIQHFESKKQIKKINAERGVDEVYDDTKSALDSIKDSLNAPKPSTILVLGGPGSGKGTQCEKIIADFGFKHLSVGDLLRAEKTSGSEIAKEIEECMTQGKLVPSEIPVKLLKKAIETAPKGTDFLIDGFPRNKENIEVWERLIGSSVEIKAILFFDCSLKTMEARILERGKTSGRSDDNADSLKKRFETYQAESTPVIEEYSKGNLLVKISAETDVDTIYKHTREALNKCY